MNPIETKCPTLESCELTGGYTQENVVHNISLTVYKGEWLSILGANGSGKSTLLRLISRILAPRLGMVLLDGKSIHTQSAQTIAQQLALLPQQQMIPSGLTVEQLVSLGRAPHQPWWQWELSPTDRQQVRLALESTGLIQYGDRPVETLSGGERQRAFLALALAQAPQVLLLDEPTTYLDLRYQLELLELLKQLNQQQGITIVTVLHDLNLAARFSDRLALLKQGQRYDLGPPAAVLTPANLAAIFGITAAILQTPIGIQICPLTPI
jgi:iron complex transport system ATP-binding protein